MVAGVALLAVAVLVPSSAGAVVVTPGITVEVDNTPYSSDQGECDESRDGWHIIMNGIETTDGNPPTAEDFGPVNLVFSDGSTAQALFTDASGNKIAHFLNDDVNQEGAFTVTAGAMTFPNGTRITSFINLVISHPPCGTIVTTTTTSPVTTVPDTTTTTVPDTTTTTVPDTTTTTVPDTTTTTVPDTTTTTSPVTTETTTTVPDTTTTTVPDTTTTTSPVTTETTTTVPDTTTTTSPVSTETTTTVPDTTTTTSPVSTETTSTTSPVSTLPTTTIPPGTPMSATIDTVYVERQVQAARTARASTGSTLPSTGVDGGPFVVTGLLLLAAGISLWAINRRKATA